MFIVRDGLIAALGPVKPCETQLLLEAPSSFEMKLR